MADGWLPAGLPIEALSQTIPKLREMVKQAGRDPSRLEIVFGSIVHISSKPLGKDRSMLTGSIDQIKEDINRVRELGVNELLFMAIDNKETIDNYLSIMTELRRFT